MQLSIANQNNATPAELIFWLDADDRSTLYSNSAGTTQIADTSGVTVMHIKNKGSVVGMNFVVNDGFPTWQRQAQNGRSFIQMNNTRANYSINISGSTPFKGMDATGGTFVWVGRSPSTTNSLFCMNFQRPSAFLIANEPNPCIHTDNYHNDSQGNFHLNWGTSEDVITVSPWNLRQTFMPLPMGPNTIGIIYGSVDPSTNLCTGQSLRMGAAASLGTAVTRTRESDFFNKISEMISGNKNGGPSSWYGCNDRLFELRIYKGILSNEERDALISSLKTKWGIV